MSKPALWWQACRPFSLTVSFTPPLIVAILAARFGGVRLSPWNVLLTLVGCMAAHIGANMVSDCMDYRKRVDRPGTFGSSGVLVNGAMTPRQLMSGGIAFYALAGAIGLYYLLTHPAWPLLLGLVAVGGILGFFYTVPPFEFKYRALGDFAVFFSFGPLMGLGAWVVHTRSFSWLPVLTMVPVGFLVDAVLHGNNLRDIESDGEVGVRTVPGRIGVRGAKVMCFLLVIGAYLGMALLVLGGQLPRTALLVFLTVPLAVRVLRKVAAKERLEKAVFATIDAEMAQLHLPFSLLLALGLFVSPWL